MRTGGKRLKGKATVSISRYTSNQWDGGITISVTDEASRIQVVEVDVPFEEFALLVTGCSRMGLEVEYGNLALVGKLCETKEVTLTRSDGGRRIDEKEWKRHEVDGWRCELDDEERAGNINHHRYSGNTGYRATFVRWVDTGKEDEK